MENKRDSTDMRALVVILTPVLAVVAKQIFQEAGIEARYEVNGEGTASREWMDVLGLGSAEKKILVSVLPREDADAMADKLGRSLPLKKAGNGIVFTLPASKMNDYAQCVQAEKDLGKSLKDIRGCYMITVIANKGCSEPVMDAARTVGATGGTVIHGEKVRHHALARAWNLHHPENKEIVMILSESAKTMDVMKAVEDYCGQDPQVQAKTFASPVEKVFGLNYYLQ